jgi:dTDP-4-dehydrorhamnose reductase
VRTVVLGASGQLGRDLVPLLPGEVIAWNRARLDLDHPERIAAALDADNPDVVVNCAAYNFVDKAESEPLVALAINAVAVGELARWCGRHNRLLVHFSTDHVFGLDNTRHVPWTEDDAPGPVSVYGVSKLAGEYLVRSRCPRHLILRTCGLYGLYGSGGKGTNFVETMLRLAGQGRPLQVVADQVCTPTATVDLARAVVELLTMEAVGLFHVTNEGGCSWYEFAAAIFALGGMCPELTPIPSSARNDPARRPAYSVLSGEKLLGAGVTIRPWREALANYLLARMNRQNA